MKTQDVVVLAILAYSRDEVVIVAEKDKSPTEWGYPGTKVAMGESFKGAASRVTLTAVGLAIDPKDFKMIRQDVGIDNVLRVSYRVFLTDTEVESITGKSPCGTRHVCIVHTKELGQYIPERHRRKMCSPGKNKSELLS